MSQRTQFVHPHFTVCSRCGQTTFHVRGLCRTCDPCTAALLQAAAVQAQSADSTPEPSDLMIEQLSGRFVEPVLTV
jgi:ribosomal protein L37E